MKEDELKENELMMSCGGSVTSSHRIFPALFAVLRWTLCELFDVPKEKWGDVEDCIVQTCWANEAQFGDEIQHHDRALREARKKLAPITPEIETAIDALACPIQILNRQGKIGVMAIVGDDTAVITVICDTSKLSPRGEVLEVVDAETLRIVLRK